MLQLLFILCTITSCFAQNERNYLTCDLPNAEVFFYPVINGKQLIEIDFFTAWNNKINCLEQAQPRALEWSMVIQAPSQPNIFMLVDSQENVLKVYNLFDQSEENIQKIYKQYVKKVNEPNFLKVSPGVRNFYHLKGDQNYHRIFAVDQTCSCNYINNYEENSCKEGIINHKGEVIIPVQYEYIMPYDSTFIVKINNKYGVISQKQKIIIAAKYAMIQPLYKCLNFMSVNCPPYGLFYALADNHKKVYILNMENKIIRTFPMTQTLQSEVSYWLREEYSKSLNKNKKQE